MASQHEQLVSKASIAISDVATDANATPAEKRESLEHLRSEITDHLNRLEDEDDD